MKIILRAVNSKLLKYNIIKLRWAVKVQHLARGYNVVHHLNNQSCPIAKYGVGGITFAVFCHIIVIGFE